LTNSNAEIRGAFAGPAGFKLLLKMVVAPARLVFVHDKVSIKPPSTTMFCPFKDKLLFTVYVPAAMRMWLPLGAVVNAVEMSIGSFMLPTPEGKPEGVT
jgi:hypothetical protein